MHPPPVSHRPATPVVQGLVAFGTLEILGGLLLLPTVKLWVAAPVFSRYFGALTGVAALARKLRRKTMKKHGAKGGAKGRI